MVTVSPITNYNATYPFADFSLAGRIPPGYQPPDFPLPFFNVPQFQMRPNLLNPRKLIENRKYSDNPIQPYVSTYDVFTVPITFEVDSMDWLAAAQLYGPNGVPIITGVRCRLLCCEFESPLPSDGKLQVDWQAGNPKIKGLKLNPAGLPIWRIGALQEPHVYGSTPIASLTSLNPLGDYTAISQPSFPTPEDSAGETFTYKVQGYFTERNFFDREWITQWGPFRIKVDAFGAYFQNPATYAIPPLELTPFNWIPFENWTPDLFYQPNLGLANKIDAPTIERFIKGATTILQYKPSEIGSLRFYFYFQTTTNVDISPITTNNFFGTLTVKYNQDVGTERLNWALRKQNPKQDSCPFLDEEEVDFQLE